MLNPKLRKSLLVACILSLAAILIVCQPITLPTDLDFSQLYISLQRAYEGKALYHLDEDLIEYNSRQNDMRGAFPFPGPPWYIALLLPLGMLSPEKAAFAWALINVVLLSFTVALTSPSYSIRTLGSVITIALLAAPVQGHLIVGQFSLITGFGIALTTWAFIRNRHALVAVGLALTTLRPHIGLPFVLAFLFWTALRARSSFIKQAPLFLSLFVLLIAASLLIDSKSITSYPTYLTILNSLPVNKLCDTCSSIPIFATSQEHFSEYGIWPLRFALSLSFNCILIAPLMLVPMSVPLFISSTVFAILLAAPYLRNYDYVLLIPPILITIHSARQLASKAAQRKVYGLLFCTVVIAGLFPYLTDRISQGGYLWLSPLIGYVATTLVIKEQRESLPSTI